MVMLMVVCEQLEEGLCQIRMALGKAISFLWIIVIQPLYHSWLGCSVYCWSYLLWSRLEDDSQYAAFPAGPPSSGS